MPYVEGLDENQISTKARPIQMNAQLLEYCEKEIKDLLDKNLIRKSHSPWSCVAFFVQKPSEMERGAPRLVINYKPLNKVLKWIRYPIRNKRNLIGRLHNASILKIWQEVWILTNSTSWKRQIQHYIHCYIWALWMECDAFWFEECSFRISKYNEWHFQSLYYSLVYIDDVLIFSNSIEHHFKHLEIFQKIIRENKLVVFAPKIKLFQTKIGFLGYEIYQGMIKPIQRSLEFSSKFPDEIKDKTQLQRFLGSLNYVSDFYPNLRTTIKTLFVRLKQNPKPWTEEHTNIVKEQVKSLPYLGLLNPSTFPIIEIDVSNIGYGGILKQDF